MKKISLIIPLYNDASRIGRCLDSVCSQTIIDQVEVIIVDDGSTDDSIKVVNTTISKWERQNQFILVSVSPNKGVANARRAGVKKSTGDYIMFCDSDDWMEPQMCEAMLNQAELFGNDLVVCDYYANYEDSTKETIIGYREPYLKELLLWTITGALWNKLIRKELLLQDRFIFPTSDFSEDFVYSSQFGLFAQNIGYVNIPLYNYLHRSGSLVRSISSEKQFKRLKDDIVNFNLVIEILRREGVYGKFREEIIVHKWKIKNHYRSNNKLWRSVYPEINNDVFKSKYISLRSKVAYLSSLLLGYR